MRENYNGRKSSWGVIFMSQSQDEQMLTIKQVARRMNVDEKTVRRWIQRGELRAINIGRLRPEYRIRPSDLERFIENRETGKDG
jgi:excisionase family DNA binding protein